MTAEQLQRVASSAASPQAVQEALTAAFPPSQGSAKRAEKLKQFFSDVMPAGSGFKVRGPSAWQKVVSRNVQLKSCLKHVQRLLWYLIALPFGAINSMKLSQAISCLLEDAHLSIAGATSLKCCSKSLLYAQNGTIQWNEVFFFPGPVMTHLCSAGQGSCPCSTSIAPLAG